LPFHPLFPLPGTPGWTEHFIRSWQRLINLGGRPDPNEPPEWGPDDEEIWIDPSR
jgi:hypothetical protein